MFLSSFVFVFVVDVAPAAVDYLWYLVVVGVVLEEVEVVVIVAEAVGVVLNRDDNRNDCNKIITVIIAITVTPLTITR